MKTIRFLWVGLVISVFSMVGHAQDNLTCNGDPNLRCGECGPNLRWTLNLSTQTLVINGTGYMNLDLYPYTPTYTFRSYTSYIRTVIIENGVTSIYSRAFAGCINLTSITIPNSVKSIGQSAFHFCNSLVSIKLPNGLTQIDDGLFYGCSKLSSITIPNSAKFIGGAAFSNCSSLTSVTIPNSVTVIGPEAFSMCSNLTSVAIPNSVIGIRVRAFSGCSKLSSVTIPANVVYGIEYNAFENCSSLTTVNYNAIDIREMSDVFLNCTEFTTLNIGNQVKTIPIRAFEGCNKLSSVTIPNSVTVIGQSAFSDCSDLGSVIISNQVKTIPTQAFLGCSSLSSVTIPNSVTDIGGAAFFDCSSLASVTIPNSVAYIREGAFWNCTLHTIYCHATEPPAITTTTFSNYSALLHVPKESIKKYKEHPIWKNFAINNTGILNLTKKYHSGYYSTAATAGYYRPDLDTYNIQGVTADGQAAIKIRMDYGDDDVDTTTSTIQLSVNNLTEEVYTGTPGALQQDADGYYFIYQAPEDFPQDFSISAYNVKIQVTLRNENSEELATGETYLSVIRPPLLLVHGLNDDSSCFRDFENMATQYFYNTRFNVLRADYSSTNKAYFMDNIMRVRQHLNILFLQCLRNGYVSAKADLIAHSMGGVLSRLHAQFVSLGDVNRIITLNTPHSGSQGANLIMADPLLQSLIGKYKFDNQFNAISDLQVNNPAIDNHLNGPSMKFAEGIPVHAVSTTTNIPEGYIYSNYPPFLGLLQLYILLSPQYKNQTVPLTLDRFCNELYEGANDLVVPLNSQQGGLSNGNTTSIYGLIQNAYHSNSPKYNHVHQVLIDLLLKPKSDAAFAKSFNPPKLTFSLGQPKSVPAPFRMAKSNDSYIKVHATAHLDESNKKMAEVTLDADADVEQKVVYGFFNSDEMFVDSGDRITVSVPDKYSGELKIYAAGRTAHDEYVTDSVSVYFDNSHLTPLYIYFENNDTLYVELEREAGRTVICGWDDNTESVVVPEFTSESDHISIENNSVIGQKIGNDTLTAQFGGLSASIPVVVIDSTRFSGSGTAIPEITSAGIIQGKLKCYPNPAGDYATIEYELSKPSSFIEICIYNMQGQIIDKKQPGARNVGIHTEKINMSSYPIGTYFILLKTTTNKYHAVMIKK